MAHGLGEVAIVFYSDGRAVIPGQYIDSSPFTEFAQMVSPELGQMVNNARWSQHKNTPENEFREAVHKASFRVYTRKGVHSFNFGVVTTERDPAVLTTGDLVSQFSWRIKPEEKALSFEDRVRLILQRSPMIQEIEPAEGGERQFLTIMTDDSKANWGYQFANNRAVVLARPKGKEDE